MADIIEALPEYLLSIVYGFIFLRSFRFFSSIKNSEGYEHIIVESLLFGCVLRSCYLSIPFSLGFILDLIGTMLTTLILSFLLAKFYLSRTLGRLLSHFKVGRNVHKCIWQDIIDPKYATWIECINPDTNESYFGRIVNVQEFTDHPYILINYFQYKQDYTKDEKPFFDFSGDPLKVIMVDTSVFSRIMVQYYPQSPMINKLEIKEK